MKMDKKMIDDYENEEKTEVMMDEVAETGAEEGGDGESSGSRRHTRFLW